MPRTSSRQASEVGRLLKEMRERHNLTQQELADATRRIWEGRGKRAGESAIERRTISAIESGLTRAPHVATLRMLGWALPIGDADRERLLTALRAAPAPAPQRPQLPIPLDEFIGRERERAAIRAALRRRRVVTLTGAAGCGKTRLALAVAGEAAGGYPDGIYLVELGGLAEPALVAGALARALGVREQDGQGPSGSLHSWARTKRLLLILDGCEGVIAPCATVVGELVARCAGVRVLATSREPLGVGGEGLHPVPPLPLPPDGPGVPLEEVLAADSAQLFVARAGAVVPGYTPAPADAAALARICRQLDGVPLALELAAARLAAFSLGQIAARLDRLFALLDGGGATPPQGRTLRAALDWSHDLLAADERALFQRLAVFAGGWTLESAEAVCADGDLARDAVLDLLARLVRRSMVVAEPWAGGAMRYRLLEPLRQYAAEQLAARDEAMATGHRHCAWVIALCERNDAPLDGGPEVAAWTDELDREVANLWAAHAWARAHDPVAGVRLAGAAWPFFFARGEHSSGRRFLGDALATAPEPTRWHGRAHYGRGVFALLHEVGAARASLDEAQALAEQWGDAALMSDLHWPLAFVGLVDGAFAKARTHLADGWALAEASDKPGRRSRYRMLRGFVTLGQGDMVAGRDELATAYSEAGLANQPLYQCMILARLGGASLKHGLVAEAIAEFDALERAAAALDSRFYRIVARHRLGMAREWLGELDAAEADYRAALALHEEAGGNRLDRATSLAGLGRVALYRRDPAGALARLQESAALLGLLEHRPLGRELAYLLGLALWRTGQHAPARVELTRALDLLGDGSDPAHLALCLEGLAALAVAAGDAEPAACWLGAAGAIRARGQTPRPRVEARPHAATRAAIAAALGVRAGRAAERSGAAQPLAEVMASARAWLARR